MYFIINFLIENKVKDIFLKRFLNFFMVFDGLEQVIFNLHLFLIGIYSINGNRLFFMTI